MRIGNSIWLLIIKNWLLMSVLRLSGTKIFFFLSNIDIPNSKVSTVLSVHKNKIVLNNHFNDLFDLIFFISE